jgi:hypothetical protein
MRGGCKIGTDLISGRMMVVVPVAVVCRHFQRITEVAV